MSEKQIPHENRFTYTYSARQNQEVQAIREKYLPCPENKMELLLRLDRSVGRVSSAVAMTNGTAAFLLFALALCAVALWDQQWLIPGICAGMVGAVGMLGTLPLYKRAARKQREKVGPQILKLTEELIR